MTLIRESAVDLLTAGGSDTRGQVSLCELVVDKKSGGGGTLLVR